MARKFEEAHIDSAVNSPPTLTPSLPGILTVTLHEGVRFSTPDHYKQRPNSNEHDHSAQTRHPPVFWRCNPPYALLDYEKCQVSLNTFWGTTESPVRMEHCRTCKFDVSRFSELTIYLYLPDPNPSGGNQDICLGVTRVYPFDGPGKAEEQWLKVQDGTGMIRISLEYVEVGNRTLETADFQRETSIGVSGSRHVIQAKKEDTKRIYAEKVIPTAELISQSEAAHTRRSEINHPFIAPLTFSFQSQKGLHLFSPFISGGHLFHHLQRERRFDVDRSRFYAAEILCALEYLHETHGIFSWLKPGNVLLDALGHVVLCRLGLFNPDIKNEDRSIYGMAEYPAPELLLCQGKYKTADWWTLGVFLFEMLTGLPMFYDEDSAMIRRKILDQPIQLPESLPLAAKDIIAKLLDRRPEKRLGANKGASEIKSHPFFDGIDWDKLLQKEYKPIFKPKYVVMSFKQHGVNNRFGPVLQEPVRFVYNGPRPKRKNGGIGNAPTPGIQQTTVKEDDGWELVWEESSRKFYFYNRFTGVKQSVPPKAKSPLAPSDATIDDSDSPTIPSRSQKEDALEAALRAGHDHVVSQLLEYDIDLNIRIFGNEKKAPLQWVTEKENIGLVRLFLSKGADANFPNFAIRGIHQGGPALIKAVEKGNREIAELLVRKADRIASTRALGLAVDRGDIAMAKLLLANGVRCDFEEGDQPHPQHPRENGCYFRDLSEPEEFFPPLVRAVKHGSVDLTRLLLSHGADANVSYHKLIWDLDPFEVNQERLDTVFSCGRAIELAMGLGHQEIVQLLLASGANIDLTQDFWHVPGHNCYLAPRATYQKVTAGLRAAAAARKENEAVVT
ncbi:Serine/threonine-protein kinase [Parahypoxylon ruwenzoriense]